MAQRLILKKSMWILKYWWIYAISLEQCFYQLSLNADSFKTADSTESVFTSIKPELKDLKTALL